MLNTLNDLLELSIIVDKAKEFPKSAYENAKEEFLQKVDLDNIKSIYQVGTTEVTGISDIDLFVIFKDNSHKFLSRYSIKNLSPDAQYLFSHEPWCMDEATFHNLPYWFPYFDLINIYGETLTPDRDENLSREISVILLTQYILTKVPIDFLIYSVLQKKFYEKIMLCMINSLRHSLTLGSTILGGVPTRWETFIEEYGNFRKKWFQENSVQREHRLKSYVVEGLLLSLELIKKLSEYIEFAVLREKIKADTITFRTKTRQISFERDWVGEKAIETILSSTSREINQSLPLSLAFYPLCWGKFSDGTVGTHIHRSLGKAFLDFGMHLSLEGVINKHIETIEHYAVFHAQKFRAPISGYHTLWAPHHPSRVVRFLDRARNKFLCNDKKNH